MNTLRPPAVPLFTHDPYLSIWSFNDRLTDDWTKHWTGRNHGMTGWARIDGKTFRFCGGPYGDATAMEQVNLEVTATRTIYTFRAAGIELTLTFCSPLLLDDLDLMSRPLSYVTLAFRSIDGRSHETSAFFGLCAEACINEMSQQIVFGGATSPSGLQVMYAANADQRVLGKAGDDLRIDWGQLFVAAPGQEGVQIWAGPWHDHVEQYPRTGQLPRTLELDFPFAMTQKVIYLHVNYTLGALTEEPVERTLMIAYDDRFSIEYLYRKLRPYWRTKMQSGLELLDTAWRERASVQSRCVKFDRDMQQTLTQVGGTDYATLCTLAYRQSIAAHKLVADFDGTPLFFSKENFSNGCIATVDVTYPSAPLYLWKNPELLKGMMIPIFEYAATPRWRFDFAPHDLGTYPLANGQVYGGGETSDRDQMPVEECGNMLILTAAVVRAEGKPDFARKYWPLLTKWAGYLKRHGLDPDNQLCTDDFAGHLAHNVNLSVKAVLGLGCYAQLAKHLGESAAHAEYDALARDYARQWVKMADDNGTHFRLAFDKPGTWSMKYNLVYDQLLGLNLFDPAAVKRELASYLPRISKYGLALDNRKPYTMPEWIVFTAAMMSSPDDFRAMIAPVVKWLNETPARVPMTDWYDVNTGKQYAFQARSPIGGVFMKALQQAWM
ncbi:MAG TPA: DUF4965 domain-containing protein [Tepidisphaeraceae bacterium]|nr:DUF4965 domain-containing protein [Tepidisphaeraceae bacterium]